LFGVTSMEDSSVHEGIVGLSFFLLCSMAQMAFEICGRKCMSMLTCETGETLFLLIHI
jgi:hypothetical protein